MNLMRADSSENGPSKLSLDNLPPAMLQKAASRLSWVALVCAGVALVVGCDVGCGEDVVAG